MDGRKALGRKPPATTAASPPESSDSRLYSYSATIPVRNRLNHRPVRSSVTFAAAPLPSPPASVATSEDVLRRLGIDLHVVDGIRLGCNGVALNAERRPRGRLSACAVAFSPSLLLCVAICCAGVRSRWQGTLVGWKGTRWTVFIRSHYGQVWVYVQATDAGEPLGWSAESWPLTRAPNPPGRPPGWGESGFAYAVGGSAGGNVARQFAVPRLAP
jgi:hypothetical protein